MLRSEATPHNLDTNGLSSRHTWQVMQNGPPSQITHGMTCPIRWTMGFLTIGSSNVPINLPAAETQCERLIDLPSTRKASEMTNWAPALSSVPSGQLKGNASTLVVTPTTPHLEHDMLRCLESASFSSRASQYARYASSQHMCHSCRSKSKPREHPNGHKADHHRTCLNLKWGSHDVVLKIGCTTLCASLMCG